VAHPHGHVVTATGAIERPLSFAGNDIPGVMLAGAVRDYVVNWASRPATARSSSPTTTDAYRTALALGRGPDRARGPRRPGQLPRRSCPKPPAPRVSASWTGRGIAKVKGGKRVTGVVCAQAGEGAELEEIACDAVAMSGGWSPVVHLWSHCGGKLIWDEARRCLPPRSGPPALEPRRRGDGQPSVRPMARAALAIWLMWLRPWAARRPRPTRSPRAPSSRSGSCRRARRQAEDEDVARLPERREGFRRAACRARGLRASNIPSATPRWAWRPIRAS
jgi:hypothetical protein